MCSLTWPPLLCGSSAHPSQLCFPTLQVAPYRAFGCDMASPYRGTLFRFPLRSAQQAASGRISKQAYEPDAIAALLADLTAEAPLMMLFLKSLESVQVSAANGGGGDAALAGLISETPLMFLFIKKIREHKA